MLEAPVLLVDGRPSVRLDDGRIVPLPSGGADDDGGGVDVADALRDVGRAADARIADAPLADDAESAGGEPLRPAPATPAPQSTEGGRKPAPEPDMPYRDAAALRQELAADRETWRPYKEALSGLDDATRAQVLASVPALGTDMATITSAFADLVPSDRQYLASLATLMQTDPVAAAEKFAEAAEQLRAAGVAPGPTLDDELSDDDSPITRADLRKWEADREAEQAVQSQVMSISTQARTLGYDPDAGSDNPVEQAKFDLLIAAAQRTPDGDLDKAHAVVELLLQARVDEAMKGKRADARRPQPPDGGGAPLSPERRLEDAEKPLVAAESSMRERLDAALGTTTSSRSRRG